VDKKCWSNVLKAGVAWPMVKRRPLISPTAGTRSTPDAPFRMGLTPEQIATARLDTERAALEAERSRLQEASLFLETCAQCITDARETVLAGIEQQLVDLVLQIATQVIHDEVTQRPELITFQVQTAILRVKEDGMMTVRVHPLMLETLRAASSHILVTLGPAARLHFEPDLSIAPGGCVVETTQQIVDARIASQLARISTALKPDRSA
jgi:flagellar assembly protein FliH